VPPPKPPPLIVVRNGSLRLRQYPPPPKIDFWGAPKINPARHSKNLQVSLASLHHSSVVRKSNCGRYGACPCRPWRRARHLRGRRALRRFLRRRFAVTGGLRAPPNPPALGDTPRPLGAGGLRAPPNPPALGGTPRPLGAGGLAAPPNPPAPHSQTLPDPSTHAEPTPIEF